MALNFFDGFLAKGSGSTSFVEITSFPGYSRQSISFGPLSNGIAANTNIVAFKSSQPWLPVTQSALFDAAGNALLWWTATTVTLGAGQSALTNPGDISLYFNDAVVSPSAILQYAAGANVGIRPSTGATVVALGAAQIAQGVLSLPPSSLLAIANLPTTLPATAGVVWNNGGVISIS